MDKVWLATTFLYKTGHIIAMTKRDNVEYQIYIGCNDICLHDVVVSKDALAELVVHFFASREIDFSLVLAKGGFCHDNGWYDVEDTVCINIIGSSDLDIIKLGKAISMFMNQKCVLVVKNCLKTEFR